MRPNCHRSSGYAGLGTRRAYQCECTILISQYLVVLICLSNVSQNSSKLCDASKKLSHWANIYGNSVYSVYTWLRFLLPSGGHLNRLEEIWTIFRGTSINVAESLPVFIKHVDPILSCFLHLLDYRPLKDRLGGFLVFLKKAIAKEIRSTQLCYPDYLTAARRNLPLRPEAFSDRRHQDLRPANSSCSLSPLRLFLP